MKNDKNPFFCQIIPIGGVGEIGSNMTLIKTPHRHILIDFGILFPDDDIFGINYLIPDLDILDSTLITDIIFTHGHEDHIGAIFHLLQKIPHIKIWAPPLAAVLLRNKLTRYMFAPKVKPLIETYGDDSIFDFDELVLSPIRVNHSIPQTYGLLIQNKMKTISCFYISDFKYDDITPYEPVMDLKKLNNLTQDSVMKILLADSTNILNKYKTPSEADLIPQFDRLLSQTNKRIFITFFPSNIHRLQTILSKAHEFKKKVVYLGQSTKHYAKEAHQLGLINYYEETWMNEAAIQGEEKNIIILLSGCQGDFKGALRQLVDQNFKNIHLRADDMVIFSSKTIPGNENKVGRIYNKISERGCELVTPDQALIHASGHPGQADLKILIDSYQPHYHYPIHGESYFLQEHVKFIKYFYPHIQTAFLTNADIITINHCQKLSIEKKELIDPQLIHGNGIRLEKSALRERRKMAGQGIIFISIFSRHSSVQIKLKFLGLPEIVSHHEEKFHHFLQSYLSLHLKNQKDLTLKEEELKVQARKFYYPILGYKPVAVVNIIE